MKCCPTCGQTVPDELAPAKLTISQRRLVERVRRAGQHGIPSDKLFDYVYEDDPDGGPLSGMACLHVRIMYINRRLKNIGKRVLGTPSGRNEPGSYRLVDI